MTKTQKLGIGVVWAALMIWGSVGVVQRLVHGHLLANYGSYVPWGLWVAAKTYFVGLAVGASFFVWVCYAFRLERFRSLIRPALLISLVTMFAGLVIIAFDLGHMWRLYEIFTRPNFSSMLAVASWFTMGYLIYVAAILTMELKSYSLGEGHRTLGWIGIVFAIIFSGGNGAEFATMVSSPYWHSTLGPVLSIGSDLCSGIALVLAAGAFFCFNDTVEDRQSMTLLSRAVIGLLFLAIILEGSQLLVSMWYARDVTYAVLRSILFGPYWYVFWIVHLLVGTVIPVVMLVRKPGNPIVAGYAGAMAAVAHFAVHLNHVIPGQVAPAVEGLQTAYEDNRLRFEYFPSVNEWAVFAFAVGLVIGLYFLGIRLLPIVSTKSLNQGGN